MKKMKKVMLIMLIVILALFVLQSIVSAAPLNITTALNNTSGNTTTNGTTDLPILTSNNQQGTNTTNNTVNNTANRNNVINNTEKLPQTGLTEDITIMFFIVLCVASAVFAYVKIRKYNDR